MRKLALILLALSLPAYAALQAGTITKQAELRSSPFADGTLVKTLPQGTNVEVVKRVGGWYEVKAPGANGWVRMWVLRFSTPAGGAQSAAQTAQVLRSGRSSSTYTTATTGVRGLSEQELANATPDPAAVQALESLAVTQSDARGFASQGSLKADPKALKK